MWLSASGEGELICRTKEGKKKNNKQGHKQQEQEHSSEDKDEWTGTIGLQAEDREQVQHHLRTEVYPENGAAGVEDLNDEDNAEHQVDQQEEDMGTQEKDIDTQSIERDHAPLCHKKENTLKWLLLSGVNKGKAHILYCSAN